MATIDIKKNSQNHNTENKLKVLFTIWNHDSLTLAELSRKIPKLSKQLIMYYLDQLQKEGIVLHHENYYYVQPVLNDWNNTIENLKPLIKYVGDNIYYRGDIKPDEIIKNVVMAILYQITITVI